MSSSKSRVGEDPIMMCSYVQAQYIRRGAQARIGRFSDPPFLECFGSRGQNRDGRSDQRPNARHSQRVGAVLDSHQPDPCHPFIDKPSVLPCAQVPIVHSGSGTHNRPPCRPGVRAMPTGSPEHLATIASGQSVALVRMASRSRCNLRLRFLTVAAAEVGNIAREGKGAVEPELEAHADEIAAVLGDEPGLAFEMSQASLVEPAMSLLRSEIVDRPADPPDAGPADRVIAGRNYAVT